MGVEKRQELERPHRCLEKRQGLRVLRHRRGNPETELDRNLMRF